MNKKVLWVAVGTLLITAGCKSNNDNKEVAAIYTVTTPDVTTTSITKDYVGNIQSQKNVEIRAQENGILQEIYVDEGQTVKAGQPLFRIAIVGADEAVAKSKAETEQARIDLQNTTTLADNNVVSKNARKMAQAKLGAALADYKMACLHRQLALIRAPFTGILGKIPNKKGSLIQEGDLLSSLSDNTNMYVYFNVSEPEYLDYQMHAAERSRLPLKLILVNGETFPAQGHIQNIEGEFDSSTGNISFRALFANANHLLRNGETGTVRMSIPRSNALIIPQQATYELQDQRYVYVVDAKGIAHAREIKVADEQPNIYVVASGLKPTDRILVDGVQKVNDGQHVQTQYRSPKAVLRALTLKAS